MQTVAEQYEHVLARAKASAAKVEELTIAMGHMSRDLDAAKGEIDQLTEGDSDQQRELQRLER